MSNNTSCSVCAFYENHAANNRTVAENAGRY